MPFGLQKVLGRAKAHTAASALPTNTSRSASKSSDPPFWLELVKHQGTAPFHRTPETYKVFRNVKDYGAVGDGITDDTDAIRAAISSGGRCGGGTCRSSSKSPAVVYFPSGTYLVSKSIIPYDHTQLIGDARNRPTLLAAPQFRDIAVIDLNPYTAEGQWYTNQNTFYRSIRNFIIDVRQVPFDVSQGTGVHYQVAQATSIMNIVIEMSRQSGTAHQGIWMENGSGGFMGGDLVFNGGKFGMWVGNQQFTVRDVTVNDAEIAIFGVWNWGWTFQDIKINNCQVGFDITAESSVGAEAIRDVVVTNTPIFLRTSVANTNVLSTSLVLNNIHLQNVPVAVGVKDGTTVLPGTTGTMTIKSWVQGNVYVGPYSPPSPWRQGSLPDVPLPPALLDNEGKVVSRNRPQYEDATIDQIVSIKDQGAKGDGVTDDTAIIQATLNTYAGSKIIFFDAGTYIITNTVTIPPGSRIVGEAWSIISGSGSVFQDINNPVPMIRVGEEGDVGVVEIGDIIFNTVGPTPGAIIIEWNIAHAPGDPASAGMWDTHIRLGGTPGTNLQDSQCPKTDFTNYQNCMAAFMAIHLTRHSTAYIEAAHIWLADHDLETDEQINVYAGRGILSESQGPVFLIGSASEHFTLYQLNLVNAKNHYMGLIQTEAPYFQPLPSEIVPYPSLSAWKDPTFPADLQTAWALTVKSSTDIFVFGAGFYSFFSSYSQVCLDQRACQTQIVDIDEQSKIYIYSLSTVAAASQISVNQVPKIDQAKNVNGFVSTVAFYTPN